MNSGLLTIGVLTIVWRDRETIFVTFEAVLNNLNFL